MTPYAEKLRDPRWQQKRLEMMERDGFRCRHCEDESKELHVHHTVYCNGNDPWEVDSSTLICLCKTCHDNQTIILNALRSDILTSLPWIDLVANLIGIKLQMQRLKIPPEKIEALAKSMASLIHCCRMSNGPDLLISLADSINQSYQAGKRIEGLRRENPNH